MHVTTSTHACTMQCTLIAHLHLHVHVQVYVYMYTSCMYMYMCMCTCIHHACTCTCTVPTSHLQKSYTVQLINHGSVILFIFFICTTIYFLLFVESLQKELVEKGVTVAVLETLRDYISEMTQNEQCVEYGCRALRGILMHPYDCVCVCVCVCAVSYTHLTLPTILRV